MVPWYLFSSIGCRSTVHVHQQMISAYDRGEVDDALFQLERLADSGPGESNIVSLNRAILYLMDSRPESAVPELECTRKRLDHLKQIDVVERGISILDDDSFNAWTGQDFERRMVDNLQIIAGFLQNDDDSFALVSRGMNGVFTDERIVNPSWKSSDFTKSGTVRRAVAVPARFAANRMTAWLAAALTSERMMDADATDRLIKQVAAWEPAGHTDVDDLHTLGTRTSQNFGTLQVVTFADRISPRKSEQALPTTAALVVADRLLSVTGDHSLPPTIFPVLVDRPVSERYEPMFVTHMSVGSAESKSSRLLVDLNAAAWDAWQADRDQQLARAVVRRVVKKSAVYGARNALGVRNGSGADLLLNVGGMIWEAHERPDLRQWNLLPAAIEVAQMELPAGNHTVRLQVFPERQQSPGRPVDQVELPVMIEDGRNTFVVCFRPRNRLVGIQCNRPGVR